jgi:hypothetical protein
MKFHTLAGLILLFSTLIGCGDDIASSSNRRGGLERNNQGATREGQSQLINSHLHRLRASAPILSYAQEIDLTLSNTLPSGLRRVPLMELDDEGTHGKNVVTQSRPTVECGVGEAFTGIDGRINDCNSKNGTNSIWNGYLSGAAGEGSWKLVALTSTGRETWVDLKTGMVWSDVVASGNWCKASGNTQESMIGVDTDCSVIGESDSFCYGTNSEGFGNNIQWRLPTRNDYLQADINGLRFVLKQGGSTGFWTATMVSGSLGRGEAWVYNPQQGTLSSGELTSSRQVRCIGIAVN